MLKPTGVDEELVGDSRVIHIVDGAGKEGGEDLQIGEHSLDKSKEAWVGQAISRTDHSDRAGCFDRLPPGQAWTAGRGWTGPHLQRGCCCGRPRLHGSGPPESS